MSTFLLARCALLRATAALAAAVGFDEEGAAGERRRGFWFLDRWHTGLHDVSHFVGYVDAQIPLPPSPAPDFVGAVSIAPPRDGGGGLDLNLAWKVEQVLSRAKHLYRACLTNSQLDDAKPLFSSLMPDDDVAGGWMSPAEVEQKHGIVIRRQ